MALPVIALNLAVTTTDPPVLALKLPSLATAARPARAGALLGVACAMKARQSSGHIVVRSHKGPSPGRP
jgi:hypothetical protein